MSQNKTTVYAVCILVLRKRITIGYDTATCRTPISIFAHGTKRKI